MRSLRSVPPPRDPLEAARGARLALSRLERAQDTLRGLIGDVEEAQALANPGEPDAKLATVVDQLLVARHKLALYVQAFQRERAEALREF